MIPRLKALLQNADNGAADALLLTPRTLRDILLELENMCVTSDEIECRPCDGGRAGFWMKIRRGGNLFYIVQNGELKAGYIPFENDPNAPGL
jgi:hypothetical protein